MRYPTEFDPVEFKRGYSKLRVLVVDDQPDLTKMLGNLLEQLGCEVRTCNRSPDCLPEATTFKPQLAFLDVAMPEISGIDLAKQLRAAGLPRFMLVASTGHGDDQTKRECLAAGFDVVMIKPLRFKALDKVVGMAREAVSQPALLR